MTGPEGRGRRADRPRWVAWIAGVALALAPSFAGAQSDRLAARLDSATRAAVARSVELARVRGLPTEPLMDKALEGATKSAPGPRIAMAVESLLDRMEISRAALAPSPSASEIAAGADALAFGAPRQALESVRAIRPHGSVAVPLAVLTQLVASGVPPRRATALVAKLLERGARDEQLIALSDDVRLDIAAGAAPEAALDVRTRGLTAVLPPPPALASPTDGQVGAQTTGATPGTKRP